MAVEEALRKKPMKKVFTIAWKKIYPNSPIPDMPVFEVWKLRKTQQWLLKLRDRTITAIVGCADEHESVLKTITTILSKSEAR